MSIDRDQLTDVIVIIGSPASGKTTVATLLYTSLIDRHVNGDIGNWVYVDKDATTRHMRMVGVEVVGSDPEQLEKIRNADADQLSHVVAAHAGFGSNVILTATLEGFLCNGSPWVEGFEANLAAATNGKATNRQVRISYFGLTVSAEERKRRLLSRGLIENGKTRDDLWPDYIARVAAYDGEMGQFVVRIDATNKDPEVLAREIWQSRVTQGRILPKGCLDDLPAVLRTHGSLRMPTIKLNLA